MQYRWTMHTINARRGDVRELDPKCPNTEILRANGVIEPIETKVTAPKETKRRRKSRNG